MKNLLIGLALFFALGNLVKWLGEYSEDLQKNPRYETSGYTELSDHRPNIYQHPDDNYAVFRKQKTIMVPTGLLPWRIIERDGMITRVDEAMKMPLPPIALYKPATPAEQALWLKYFKLDESD